MLTEPSEPCPIFRTPDDVGKYLLPRFGAKPVEEFGLLILDTRNRLKRLQIISRGNLNGSLVHPREVFREAVALQTAGLVLFHNHPSGVTSHRPGRTGRSRDVFAKQATSWGSKCSITSSSDEGDS